LTGSMITTRDTIQLMIERLNAEALKAVNIRRRDPREPGRREKEQADARLALLWRRIFRRQAERIRRWLEMQPQASKAAQLPPDWDELDDEDEAELIALLADARRSGIKLTQQQIDFVFDDTAVNARAATRARRYSYDLIKRVDAVTKDAVRQAVTQFVETPGMTIREAMNMMPFHDDRAANVAVTEITRAYSDGAQDLGEELKEKYPDVDIVKHWYTNEDDKVCLLCGPLGEMEDVDFDYQYFDPDEYSDGKRPPRHVACRCWPDVRTKIA
jgi:hypothetical protein